MDGVSVAADNGRPATQYTTVALAGALNRGDTLYLNSCVYSYGIELS